MDFRTFYEANGYVVCKNLMPPELIDTLVKFYKQQIVSSKEPFYRQMTNTYEQNNLNEFGHVKQDFLDVHSYKNSPEFSTSVKQILCSDAMLNSLREITGSNSFKLMQSLLFDMSRETQPHQDSYYLDTLPGGNLIAVWIALEDIDEKAGRFYVIPKSTDVDLPKDTQNFLSHREWLGKMKYYIEANQDKIEAPPLNKGDAILWNSKLVHGALPIVDHRFSRKSLTGHYIPSEYNYGNLFITKDYIELETYKGVKIYSATVAEPGEWSSGAPGVKVVNNS